MSTSRGGRRGRAPSAKSIARTVNTKAGETALVTSVTSTHIGKPTPSTHTRFAGGAGSNTVARKVVSLIGWCCMLLRAKLGVDEWRAGSIPWILS